MYHLRYTLLYLNSREIHRRLSLIRFIFSHRIWWIIAFEPEGIFSTTTQPTKEKVVEPITTTRIFLRFAVYCPTQPLGFPPQRSNINWFFSRLGSIFQSEIIICPYRWGFHPFGCLSFLPQHLLFSMWHFYQCSLLHRLTTTAVLLLYALSVHTEQLLCHWNELIQ